jgi:hypothetical protein
MNDCCHEHAEESCPFSHPAPITPFWLAFGDRVGGVIEYRTIVFHLFFTWSVSLSRCLSFPYWPFLLALRSLHAQSSKEGCASLCFLCSLMLSVPCVALLLHIFIVAINADSPICPVPGSLCAFISGCGNFSVMSPAAHEKFLPSG